MKIKFNLNFETLKSFAQHSEVQKFHRIRFTVSLSLSAYKTIQIK